MHAIPRHSFNSHDIIRREIANQLLVSLWPEAALKCVLAATSFIIRRELFCLLSIPMCTICSIDLFAFHFAFYFNEDNWSLLFFLAQTEINQLSLDYTHGIHCSLLRGTKILVLISDTKTASEWILSRKRKVFSIGLTFQIKLNVANGK